PKPKLPRMVLVPAQERGEVHPAIAGREVIVKAVLGPQPGRFLKYAWDFGDGTEPVAGVVTDPYAVGANHSYTNAKIGDEFAAKLRITDAESGDTVEAGYRVRFVEPTLENKTTVALDDALWALHASMKREEHPTYGPIGHWNSDYYPTGSTAMAALALEVN